jgi:ubiquinone/menaquinone biosynthesis C-methylase UbiE
MTLPPPTVQADFDRIALLAEEGWDHNSHYHDFLLKQVPRPCPAALEIGCGTGVFARLLAGRAEQVMALDLSPQMIRLARERSGGYPNLDFQTADLLSWELPGEPFDCVVSIATLHHLPFTAGLAKMKSVLKPNGVLLVLDLFQPVGAGDWLTGAIAAPTSLVLRLIKRRHLKEKAELQAAWAEHGRNERYPTLAEVRRVGRAVLPGVEVRKHLLWRYSLIWKKV